LAPEDWASGKRGGLAEGERKKKKKTSKKKKVGGREGGDWQGGVFTNRWHLASLGRTPDPQVNGGMKGIRGGREPKRKVTKIS